MGYQPGKGLGKSLQGRNTIIEAQVRKGRGAVGINFATVVFLGQVISNSNFIIRSLRS